MRPFNNHLIVEPIVDDEIKEENSLFIAQDDRQKKIIKVRLLKYCESSQLKHIWTKSINNIIYVNSSFMFSILEKDKTYYLVPESAAVCGYYSKPQQNENGNKRRRSRYV